MVWIGHKASDRERKQALSYGISYLTKYGRPINTPLSRYLEGGETKVGLFGEGGAVGATCRHHGSHTAGVSGLLSRRRYYHWQTRKHVRHRVSRLPQVGSWWDLNNMGMME